MNRYVKLEDFERLAARLAVVEEALESLEDTAALAALESARAEDDGVRIPGEAVTAMIVDGVHPLKAIRKSRHMTQKQLAEMAGTSAVYLSQIERGQRHAGRKLQVRLAKALRVTPGDLRAG